MTRDVHVARPDQTIQNAAQMMSDIDAGMLSLGDLATQVEQPAGGALKEISKPG